MAQREETVLDVRLDMALRDARELLIDLRQARAEADKHSQAIVLAALMDDTTNIAVRLEMLITGRNTR